jgi:uncharacterized protein YxjI
MRQEMAAIGDDFWIENMSTVKKALITPVRERWVVKMKVGPDLEVQGNILDHEYTLDPGQEDVLILAAAVCIDEMAHGGH